MSDSRKKAQRQPACCDRLRVACACSGL